MYARIGLYAQVKVIIVVFFSLYTTPSLRNMYYMVRMYTAYTLVPVYT